MFRRPHAPVVALAARAAVETLERRTHFALVTFTLDPALSSLQLSGNVSVIDLEPQGSGALLAAYEGTIAADLDAGVITFPGGTNVVAQSRRNYDPGSGPANYGGEAETGGFFNVKIGEAAIRNFKFEIRSDALIVAESGAFSAAGLDVKTTGGKIEYELEIGGDGDIEIDNLTIDNNGAGNATIRGTGANLTLTIPIEISIDESSADLTLRGTLVANAGTGAPIDPNTIRLGAGAGGITSVQFRETDGTRAEIELRGGGSADVRFANAASAAIGKGGTIIVSGDNVSLLGVDVVGAARSTKVTINGRGGPDKVVAVASLTADGQVGTLGGKGVVFTGPVTVNGRISSFTANGLAGATVTADSIGSTKITGDVTTSTITLDAPFAPDTFAAGKFTVGGAFSQSRLTAAGAIGPIKATTLIRSEIYSAVNSAAVRFPETTDLFGEGSIGSVTVKNFADGVLAADQIGKMKLGTVVTDNQATPMGITADAFAGLTAKNESKKTLKLKATDDPAELAAALAAANWASGDFVIRLA